MCWGLLFLFMFKYKCISMLVARAQHNPSLPPEHLIMYLGKETSTLGITGLTFLRIASP